MAFYDWFGRSLPNGGERVPDHVTEVDTGAMSTVERIANRIRKTCYCYIMGKFRREDELPRIFDRIATRSDRRNTLQQRSVSQKSKMQKKRFIATSGREEI